MSGYKSGPFFPQPETDNSTMAYQKKATVHMNLGIYISIRKLFLVGPGKPVATRYTSNVPAAELKRTLFWKISTILAPETVSPSRRRKPFTTTRDAARRSCQAMPDTLISAGAGTRDTSAGLAGSAGALSPAAGAAAGFTGLTTWGCLGADGALPALGACAGSGAA